MKAILLFVLSAIVLSQSYGFAHADHVIQFGLTGEGLEDSAEDATITVATDSSSYEEGEMINVSGSVSDYDESDPYKNFDVTLRLIDPKHNIITISQIALNSDGSYSTFIPAQGPLWKFDGDYTISVSHGSDENASTTFVFISAPEEVIEEVIEEEVIEISEEELVEEVEETETPESTSVSTGSSPTTGFSSWVYSISFTVLIAFAIMIILYLISRASKNKTVDY